jgi:biotin carboxylase
LKGKVQEKMNRESRAILVVGTTPDYVARLCRDKTKPLLFLAAERFRADPRLRGIPPSDILFASLDAFEETLQKVLDFSVSRKTGLSGVACFDCESLVMAARLASRLELPFPSWQAIARSRNKFEARRTWTATGINSPFAFLSSDLQDTLHFFRSHGDNIVLKPVSGSGSELLFHCVEEGEVRNAVAIMEEELPLRKTNPLFAPFPDPFHGRDIDPCRSWIAEEFVSGQEFSCDFVYQDEEIVLVRETGKVKATDKPFGSVLAYTFPPLYPERFKKERLLEILKTAVRSLGFEWGFFMADYVIREGFPVLIELTPRPGGDSIPDLVKIGAGRDTLGLYLDFVAGAFKAPDTLSMRPESYASINLFAPKEGKILKLDGSKIRRLSHVKTLFFKKAEGDRIVLPPKDYDNRLLGYCIVATEPGANLIEECRRLEDLLAVSIQ